MLCSVLGSGVPGGEESEREEGSLMKRKNLVGKKFNEKRERTPRISPSHDATPGATKNYAWGKTFNLGPTNKEDLSKQKEKRKGATGKSLKKRNKPRTRQRGEIQKIISS